MRFSKWTSSGRPWIWLNAAAIAISILMVVGLVSLLGVRGLSYFWPSDVMQARYTSSEPAGSGMSMDCLLSPSDAADDLTRLCRRSFAALAAFI